MSGRFIKPSDIAKDLDVSEDTVRLWIRTKQLPAVKVGREYRILKTEYEQFLKERRTVGDAFDDGE
jgi:excisionase family DNA binding protein